MTAYTTPQYVQEELKATTSFSDTTYPSLQTVQRWISEAEASIDNTAGKSYGESTVTEYIDYDGEDRILLSKAPVISVTTVKSSPYTLGDSQYPAWETKTAGTHYSLYDKRGELLVLNNWTPKSGPKSIEVVYVTGYDTVPLTIQLLATKMVAKRCVDAVVTKDLAEKQSGKSISVGSISIVKPAQFGVLQYAKIKEEIDDLTASLVQGTTAVRFNNY